MNQKYQYIGFLPKSVRIKENGYWGLNDFEGNQILPSNYIELFTLSSGKGLIAARDAGFWDIYDYRGNRLNSERYDYVYPYYGLFGMTKVRIGEKWGLLNKYGKLILPIIYKKIEKFGKGMIFHSIDNEIEFIDQHSISKLTEINESELKPLTKKSTHKKVVSLSGKKTKV